jgi:peptide deformylase
MTIDPNARQAILDALARMKPQGLSEEMADNALECADKMFQLIEQYQGAGLVALGMVGASIDQLIVE